MINNLNLNKKKEGGAGPLMPVVMVLKIALKILMKKLKFLLLKKPFGLLHPFSMTFFTITIPILLIILSIHNSKIKSLVKKYLDVDILKTNSYFKKESLRELTTVYGSYFILSQIFFVILLNPSSKRKIKRGKITTMGLLDIPRALFDIFSLIIIPRMASNYIDKNIYFQFDKNKKISAQILYYTAILGIIGFNNIWNYTNLLISLFFTFITIILLENKQSVKKIFYNLFGFEFPSREYKKDYMKVCFFIGIFCFTIFASFSKYIPFYDDLLGSELHILEVIIKILFCVWLPIQMRKIAKDTQYESEMFLLGNLISIFIPILFSDIIDMFYEGVDFVSEGIDMAEEAYEDMDMEDYGFEDDLGLEDGDY